MVNIKNEFYDSKTEKLVKKKFKRNKKKLFTLNIMENFYYIQNDSFHIMIMRLKAFNEY